MADYGAYTNPEILYDAQNAQLAANTVSSWRKSMAEGLNTFVQIKQGQQQELERRRKKREQQLASSSASYNNAYLEARNAADKFTQGLKGKGKKEALNMNSQMRNALYQVGEQLNKSIQELGPDASQFKIDQLTADAVAEVTKLKNDMTNIFAAYEEYEAAKFLDPGDPKAILGNSNPEMQLLFDKLDNDEDDVILSRDPSNGNWLLIPVESSKYDKISNGEIDYDKSVGIIDASDFGVKANKNGGYFNYVGQEDFGSEVKAFTQAIDALGGKVKSRALLPGQQNVTKSNQKYYDKYDHGAINTYLTNNPQFKDNFRPMNVDAALQQIMNKSIYDIEQGITVGANQTLEDLKLEMYYDALIEKSLAKLPNQ
jgi:hypothetical protein